MTTASDPALDDLSALTAVLGKFQGRRVLCVGDVMVDRSIYGEVKRISPEAPVPVVRITRETSELGGAGNVVRNLAALGASCAFVAAIGDDRAGQEVSNLLARLPVEPYLRVSRQRETTIKNRFFSLDGHHLLRADRETRHPLAAADAADVMRAVNSELLRAEAVILSDYGKGVLSGDIAQAVITAAKAQRKPVIVDPKGADYARYTGATVLTPNRSELAEATGLPVDTTENLVTAARGLARDVGVGAVLVTRSGEGMTLVTADGAVHHQPAETREIADVTGAGDTVAATLTLGLACNAPLPMAMRLANVAAGVVVGRHGTAVASVQDITAALRQAGHASVDQKVVDRAEAIMRIAAWRRAGLKVGFTNGCFDLLHPGHVSLLRQARACCDRLVVALNSDASVKRLKGEGRPVQAEAARAAVMASLASADLVTIFGEDTPLALIEALRPDVLVKGADYTRAAVVGGDFVESYGGRVVLAELVPSVSTTATITALKGARTGL
ncbi:MAG: D-glycero-beta-D-manno-heptose-7-phosphate kinase [Rhodospirillaceae bacterium]